MADSALIDDLEKQFAENPRRVFARLANEYRKAGDAERAIEICRHHVPQQPGYISGHIVLGQALFDTAQFDEARSAFETALGLDPENLIALRQLGDIARETGDREGARSWYRRLLEVDPQNDEVTEQLEALDGEVGGAAPEAPTDSGVPAQEQVQWGDIHPEDMTPTSHGGPPEGAEGMDEGASLLDVSLAIDGDIAAGSDGSDAVPPLVEPEIVLDTPTLAEQAVEVVGESVDAVDAEVLVPLDLEQPFAEGDAPAPAAVVSDASTAEDGGNHSDVPAVGGDAEEAPDTFVTETMAEVYVRQGFVEQALDIYRQLARQSPGEQRFTDAVTELEQAVALAAESSSSDSAAMMPIPDESAPVGPTIREFLNAIASRQPAVHASDPEQAEEQLGEAPPLVPEPDDVPALDDVPELGDNDAQTQSDYQIPVTASSDPAGDVGDAAEVAITSDSVEPAPTMDSASATSFDYDELFPGRSVAQSDEAAADALAGGYATDFEMNGDSRGAPARPAPDALSLDAVFGQTSAPEAQAPQEQSVSFDEFFAGEAGTDESATPSDTATPPSDGHTDSPSDLELFHAWLEGLKK